jgi:alanyl-tRNA synthetase
MKTIPIYYDDPYKKELECTVISVEPNGSHLNVILDQTIFYPEGGGQPCDRGRLGETHVEYVRMVNGEIVHQVKGNLQPNQKALAALDWDWRYKYMRIHTAGHLLHDCLMTITKGLTPIRGGHGKKAFLEYQGELNPEKKDEIENKVNEILNTDLPVITKQADYETIEKECQFIPANLPRNKPLRMIKIGDFPGMPDGGVQVARTKEIGKIWIANIIVTEGKTTIRYGVTN